jgi:ferredoxin-fold anticodon binding domain-containing protein
MDYLVGSKELGLKNCKDTDKIIITKSGTYRKEVKENTEIAYISESTLDKLMRFKLWKSQFAYLMMFAYQLDYEIIGKDFPYEYHIIDYRKELIEYLNYIIKNELFNFNKRVTINKNCCSKYIYHIAYNAFILRNNSSIITKKQKKIIQRIHDGKMPIEFLDKLKQIIEEET